MKRIHLFEIEDLHWFPNWLRICMTRYIVPVHKIIGSANTVAALIARALKESGTSRIIDLCSGAGGPMLQVAEILRNSYRIQDLQVTLSDLYPNQEAAAAINAKGDPAISYLTTPVNAADLGDDKKGLRTMICSMHHMKPEVAHSILKDAQKACQPICIFEISDNSFPVWLWWTAIPANFAVSFFVTPMIRPLTWQQIMFTYLIPVLPLFIAWDGAVSNARTYTLEDMDELISGLESDDYIWEKGKTEGKTGKGLYLLGLPKARQ